MTTIDLSNTSDTDNSVSEDMFGTNFLARFYNLDDQMQEVLQTLSVTTLRYPGGEITESSFSIYNPNRTTDDQGRQITPISDFVDFCLANNYSFTLVLPTRDLLGEQVDSNGNRLVDPSKITDTINFFANLIDQYSQLGAEGLMNLIRAVEIGNEYWGSGQMTGTEYGRIVEALTPALYDMIYSQLGAAAAEEIDIIVQMGAPWSRDHDENGRIENITSSSPQNVLDELGLTSSSFNRDGNLTWMAKIDLENRLIIQELSEEARSAIGGLVEHYYFDQTGDDIDFTSPALNYINSDIRIWEQHGFFDLDLHITEWNVSTSNITQLGLRGAGAFLVQFEYMLRLGADVAHVWPIQHNTRTDLAGLYGNDPQLSPSGLVFQHLADNVVGLTLQDVQFESGNLEVVSFGDNDTLVIYVISRSPDADTITLSFRGLLDNYTNWTIESAQVVGVDQTTSDGIHRIGREVVSVQPYSEHDALGSLDAMPVFVHGPDSDLTFDLDGFEIAMIVIDLDKIGWNCRMPWMTDQFDTKLASAALNQEEQTQYANISHVSESSSQLAQIVDDFIWG